jgi:hypothetical protein
MQKNNKTITGLAAASLLALPLAGESVTWDAGDLKVNFHGSLRPSINADDCSSPCKGGWRGGPAGESLAGKKSTYMTSNFSHFQFDGTYKLNEKNSAVFKLEWKIDASEALSTSTSTTTATDDNGDTVTVTTTHTTSNTLVDFEQYLGLKGGYGMFRFGTILTPYMQSGVKLDPFRRDSIAGRFFVDIYSALHHNTGFGRGRATNTIRYDSPKFFGGLAVQGFYTLDETSNDNHGYGGGVTYDSKMFYGFLQYYDANRNGKSDATKVGGKVKFGKSGSIFGQYESDGGLISLSEGLAGVPTIGDLQNYTTDNNVDGADVYVLGGTFNINKFELIGQVGERSDSSKVTSSADADGHTGYLVGAAYRQTKQLYYYGGYLVKDFNRTSLDKDERVTVGTTFTW